MSAETQSSIDELFANVLRSFQSSKVHPQAEEHGSNANSCILEYCTHEACKWHQPSRVLFQTIDTKNDTIENETAAGSTAAALQAAVTTLCHLFTSPKEQFKAHRAELEC